jgi:hypothetical protein
MIHKDSLFLQANKFHTTHQFQQYIADLIHFKSWINLKVKQHLQVQQ